MPRPQVLLFAVVIAEVGYRRTRLNQVILVDPPRMLVWRTLPRASLLSEAQTRLQQDQQLLAFDQQSCPPGRQSDPEQVMPCAKKNRAFRQT